MFKHIRKAALYTVDMTEVGVEKTTNLLGNAWAEHRNNHGDRVLARQQAKVDKAQSERVEVEEPDGKGGWKQVAKRHIKVIHLVDGDEHKGPKSKCSICAPTEEISADDVEIVS